MAVAVVIVSVIGGQDPSGGIDQTANELIVDGTLTLSSTYGAALGNGDVVDFTNQDQTKSELIPRKVEIYEDQGAGNAPLGYTYIYAHGTTQANGKLVITNQVTAAAKTGAVQFTQGDAYSTGTPSLDGAVLRFRAWFSKFM